MEVGGKNELRYPGADHRTPTGAVYFQGWRPITIETQLASSGDHDPTAGFYRRMQRLPLYLRLLLLGRFSDLGILSDRPVENQRERAAPRFSATATNSKVSSPNPNMTTRMRRGRYSICTLWSPGGNLTPAKLGISMTVSVSTPSTVARQFG